MEKIIEISREKCIGCGLCAKDCPASAIKVVGGKAVFYGGCIECGHCYAVCPKEAIGMCGYDDSDCGEVTSMEEIDTATLLNAMKSRRTIRQYKDIPVEQEKIDKILEAGRYAPTGKNAQTTAFTVLGSMQDDIEKGCVKLFRGGVEVGKLFSQTLRNNEIDDNFFFKKAPLVIVVSGKDGVSASLASAYMELCANSMGLAVLYSGFFVACTIINPLIKNKLRLPRGHRVITCMIIGYPDVEYRRIPPRKPLDVKYL